MDSRRQVGSGASDGSAEQDFLWLRQDVFARYRAGDHAGALAAARAGAARFPERDATTTYWIACLEAQSGQHDRAVRTLREALARGLWWSAAWLQGERDFAPLRERADFQETVAEHDRRREAAEAGAGPEVMVIPPVDRIWTTSPDTPPPLVLALHMRNGSARDSAPYWSPATAFGALVALAQSSQRVSAVGHCWDDEARARDDVAWALSEARRQHAVDSERLVLAGASQGGKLAVELALRGEPVLVRGFIAVVPSITKPAPLFPLVAAAAARGLRGWILTGEHDGCRPGVEALHGGMTAAGLPCVLEVVQGLGHDFPTDFGERLPAALEHVLGLHGARRAP
jgi:predicted esterase